MNAPKSRGFHMPAEWHPHRRCWMAWPSHVPSYNGRHRATQVVHANVARAIAQFEPVVMIANAADVPLARSMCGPGIEVRTVAIDDGWFRDSGPTFVIDGREGLLGIDWEFNGWGGRTPFENDRQAAAAVLAQQQVERVAAPLVLEGGSFHVDGEGTLITTEECLLNPNRNPTLSRADIETHLREFLGVDVIIWLKGGPVDDVTDGHVDMVASFTAPGQVVALHCDDPQDANYAVLQANREILRGARDARGRSLEVIDIPQLPAAYIEQTGGRLGFSHVNYYTANGGIVLPWFGVPELDARVAGIFREIYPDRTIVPVATRDLLYGGGNIHCITQQEPFPTALRA
jgi:agmatine deiminase